MSKSIKKEKVLLYVENEPGWERMRYGLGMGSFVRLSSSRRSLSPSTCPLRSHTVNTAMLCARAITFMLRRCGKAKVGELI